MREVADLWKPALIAGGVFGFVSGVPYLGEVNIACCCLIVGAGALTAMLMVRDSIQALTYGRAALGGMVAGAVASPVQSVTSLLLGLLMLRRGPGEQIQDALDQMSQIMPDAGDSIRTLGDIPTIVWTLVSMVVFMFVFGAFGALGGVIGRAIFEKRVAAPPSPPAPSAPTIPS